MKRFNKILTLTLVVAMVLSLSLMFVGCKKKPADTEDPVPTSFVSMDINPSVELVLDQENKVMDVVCANEDAAIMLYGREGIVGASVDVASKNIIDAAVEFKYVNNEDAKNVAINVSSSDVAKVNAIVTDTKASIKAELDLKGIEGKVEEGVDYMLQKELDALKAKKADNTNYQNMDLAKYRLVKRALLANVTLTMDEAVAMSNAELIKTIDYAKDTVKNAYDKATAAAIKVATVAYDQTKANLLDAVYVEVFTKGAIPGGKDLIVDKSLAKSTLAAQYMALNNATFAVETTTNVIRKAIDAIEIPVAPVKAALVKAGLSEEQANKLDDYAKNGKITKDSLVAYINKAYRNMSDEQRTAFDGKFEASVGVQVNEFQAKADTIIEKNGNTITAALKVKDLNGEFDADAKVTLTIESIDTIITKLHKATDAKYEAMIGNLTDEGKAQVEEKQANLNNKLTDAETKFENAVKKANEDIEAAIKKAQETKKLELNIEVEVK